jgi:hypothetical protein
LHVQPPGLSRINGGRLLIQDDDCRGDAAQEGEGAWLGEAGAAGSGCCAGGWRSRWARDMWWGRG